MKKLEYPVSIWKQLRYSDELVGLNCVKEYLAREIEKLYREANEQAENAYNKKLPSYLIGIFKKKLEERRDFLRHLLNDVQFEINQLPKP